MSQSIMSPTSPVSLRTVPRAQAQHCGHSDPAQHPSHPPVTALTTAPSPGHLGFSRPPSGVPYTLLLTPRQSPYGGSAVTSMCKAWPQILQSGSFGATQRHSSAHRLPGPPGQEASPASLAARGSQRTQPRKIRKAIAAGSSHVLGA